MPQTTPRWGRYVELRPDTLADIRAAVPVAYLPWGALEWHGPHLPLGLDGIVAEAVAERVARSAGGVVLPTTWWPITALPHADSLSVRSAVIRALWDDIFAGLARARWRVVVVISGHYSQGHELMLMDAAESAMDRHNLLVLALPPLALVDEEMLDHAALWETSLLLALRSGWADLDALGTGPLAIAQSAVLGRDPRGLASASLGSTTLDLAVERITRAVTHLLEKGQKASLRALYEQRRVRYKDYLARYGNGSPEKAAQRWWHDITAADGETLVEHQGSLAGDERHEPADR